MNKVLVTNALTDVVKAHRAHVRWLAWCDGLHAAMKVAGVYEPAEYPRDLAVAVQQTYMSANKKPAMPSKNRKHQMYGDAYRAADLAGLFPKPGSISTLDDIADVIARVTAALASA